MGEEQREICVEMQEEKEGDVQAVKYEDPQRDAEEKLGVATKKKKR